MMIAQGTVSVRPPTLSAFRSMEPKRSVETLEKESRAAPQIQYCVPFTSRRLQKLTA